MTTDDFIKKMDKQIAEIEKTNIPLSRAVGAIMSLQSKRIFLEGKNTDEAIIGSYKGGEIYIDPIAIQKNATKPLKKFILYGKDGSRTLKNGEERKTGYFKSYLDFKIKIGLNRRRKTVDLFLTGTLHQQWANSLQVGKAQAIRINQHNYITQLSDENLNKVERYGRVFNLSVKEKQAFLFIIQKELAKALQ